MFSDQFYWASRVRALGVGSSVVGPIACEALTTSLREALDRDVVERARSFVSSLANDGAAVAARKLVELGRRPSLS